MMRDLIAHKEHANTILLTATRQHPHASRITELLELLHHILVANRFWTMTCAGLPLSVRRR